MEDLNFAKFSDRANVVNLIEVFTTCYTQYVPFTDYTPLEPPSLVFKVVT